MTEDRGDSLMDKVKDALGMGDRNDRTDRTERNDAMDRTDRTDLDDLDRGTAHDDLVVAGADQDELGGDTNRPAGPDYGAGDTTGPELGIGLDREGTTGTGEYNTGTGLGYDYDRNAVTDPGPLETEPTVGSTEWTREGAASGEAPFEDEETGRRSV